MTNQIYITGSLGQDPVLRFTPSGEAVLNGSVADTPRKYDKERGEYVDAGDTLWLSFAIFGPEAEDLAERLHKGTRVTVGGVLKARSYEKDGQRRTVNEITASSVAVHPKRTAGQGQQGAGWDKPKPANDDPWAAR